MASQYETYLRRYLNDNGTLWTSAQIERWALRAENELCRVWPAVNIRVSLAILPNVPLYTIPTPLLPNYPSLGINQITYKGDVVLPLSQQQAHELFSGSVITDYAATVGGAFQSNAFQNNAFQTNDVAGYATMDSSTGKPIFWAYSGYDEKTIQFFPTPNETVSGASSANLWDSDIATRCIVEYRTFQIEVAGGKPFTRLIRQLIKDYVLSEAFGSEGKGQQKNVAIMLRKRFEQRLELYRILASNVFVANKHRMGNQSNRGYAFPNRPNFGNDLGRRIS